jgi:hypothetical protein
MRGDDAPHCTRTSRRVSEKRDSALLLGAFDEAGPHWVEMNVFHFLAGGILRP